MAGRRPPPIQQNDNGVTIRCPKCGSSNIKFEHEHSSTIGAKQNTVTVVHKNGGKGHGILWWLCIGWWYWMLIGWWLAPLKAVFGGGGAFNKSVSKEIRRTMCICQGCGYTWKAK